MFYSGGLHTLTDRDMIEAGSPQILDVLIPHGLTTETVPRSHVHGVTHLHVLQIWFSINLNSAVVVNTMIQKDQFLKTMIVVLCSL